MALLLILLLNTTYSLANEIIDDQNIMDKTSQKLKNNNTQDINNLLDQDIALKDIPITKISDSEKKELRDRNPFLPPGSENSNTKSGINLANMNFKGIAMVGDSKVVFIETSEGANAYEINQIIGGGYKVSNIDEHKLIVEISSQSKTHSIKLEKDEN